jgi:hypothetical protein
MFYFSNHTILAIALHFIRISSLLIFSLLLLLITTRALLHASTFVDAAYVQPIGTGMFAEGLILLSYPPFEDGGLAHHLLSPTSEAYGGMGALTPIKPQRLTRAEQEAFTLSKENKDILVGLILGDLHVRKQKLGVNPCLMFSQGIIHKDYLLHLYDIFQIYCPQEPKIRNFPPHPKTGKVYTNICFQTYSLPIFLPLYNLFNLSGRKKVVPLNIADLLTPRRSQESSCPQLLHLRCKTSIFLWAYGP